VEHGLGGATVFKGFMGCALQADISTAGMLVLAENLPVIVDLVDEEERICTFLPFLRDAVTKVTVVCSEVEPEQVILDEGSG
jgi:uncharacterized protein